MLTEVLDPTGKKSHLDISIEVRYDGKPLPYSALHDRLQRIEQGEVVDNKPMGNVMATSMEKQAALNCESSKSVPRRKPLAQIAKIN